MSENIKLDIDSELCSGCGLCIEVCPTGAISPIEGKAAETGRKCISCGHCQAVCPQGAISILSIDREMGEFKTFNPDTRWLPHGEYDTAGLVRLMASRRSCRNYTDRPVLRELLEDLVKIGITAPSGTNSQRWTFTVLPDRKAVMILSNYVASFFKRLNATAERTFLRMILKLMGKGELDAYYRGYYQTVKEGLEEYESSGKDRLFHGAPAAIVISSKPGASCPMEDALLAAQNILLAAHSMGLGSCLIGFAVVAMKRDSGIQLSLGIPAEETVYAVISLGYPDETYQTVAGRKKADIRYFEG